MAFSVTAQTEAGRCWTCNEKSILDCNIINDQTSCDGVCMVSILFYCLDICFYPLFYCFVYCFIYCFIHCFSHCSIVFSIVLFIHFVLFSLVLLFYHFVYGFVNCLNYCSIVLLFYLLFYPLFKQDFFDQPNISLQTGFSVDDSIIDWEAKRFNYQSFAYTVNPFAPKLTLYF